MSEVDEALADYLRHNVLTPVLMDQLLVEIDAELQRQLAEPRREAEEIAEQLRRLRSEQARFAKTVALSGDIPELVKELRERNERIQRL